MGRWVVEETSRAVCVGTALVDFAQIPGANLAVGEREVWDSALGSRQAKHGQ